MTQAQSLESIARKRMHNLYLSRPCRDLETLSHELMGLHSWFYRNVAFSALIRGADITAWKTKLTKTWLYRGTLHGVVYEDLPRLLALHPGESYLNRLFDTQLIETIADEVVRYMEDGVTSRAEFRKIFSAQYGPEMIESLFSPWGGIFVYLARQGRVAFRDMASRDFDLISAEPTESLEDVLPELVRQYFAVYGPATLSDAAWFFGFWKEEVNILRKLPLDDIASFDLDGVRYYDASNEETEEIPPLALLSGFDPIVVSYTDRRAVLPVEYKSRVILKSGICNPSIAIDGRIAGIWNITKNEPVVEFFEKQPKRVVSEALARVDDIRWRMR
ncbi:MAG: crosslink repair DNA glycosylase YcaQ family protein [Eubacteriales bacterium]|nr:crosslink repair DNA glycosylase YcaQ family protein [Eubacteriales bacterium]